MPSSATDHSGLWYVEHLTHSINAADDTFDFTNGPTDGAAGGITSDLEIWEWRKTVEDGIDSDEAIFAGELTYIEPNYNDTATLDGDFII